MPFKSKNQSKACFATKGFGGKVDCKKWADKTDYSNLIQKKGKKIKEGNIPTFIEWLNKNQLS